MTLPNPRGKGFASSIIDMVTPKRKNGRRFYRFYLFPLCPIFSVSRSWVMPCRKQLPCHVPADKAGGTRHKIFHRTFDSFLTTIESSPPPMSQSVFPVADQRAQLVITLKCWLLSSTMRRGRRLEMRTCFYCTITVGFIPV